MNANLLPTTLRPRLLDVAPIPSIDLARLHDDEARAVVVAHEVLALAKLYTPDFGCSGRRKAVAKGASLIRREIRAVYAAAGGRWQANDGALGDEAHAPTDDAVGELVGATWGTIGALETAAKGIADEAEQAKALTRVLVVQGMEAMLMLGDEEL